MNKQILALALVVLSLSVQAQYLRKSVNTNSSLKMGIQVKNVGVNRQPVLLTKSKAIVPARISAAVNGPGVSYTVPQGTLFQGISNKFGGYSNTFAYSSPYTSWNFTNKTTTSPTFLWTVSEYQGIVSTAATVDLNINVLNGSYNMPSLKGTANGADSTFIFGKSYNSKAVASYIDAGGSSYIDPKTKESFNWTNWLYDLDQVTWTNPGTNDYVFGTGTSKMDALISYYEKPQSTLYFEGANFFLGAFSAPANTTFTLRVITVNEDNQGHITPIDTLATSHATTSDVIVTDATSQVIPFTKLVALSKDGFETQLPYLELNEPFILELSGFNASGVILGMRCSYYDNEGTLTLPYTSNHAFFYAPDTKGVRSLESYTWPSTLVTTLTNAAYSYILSSASSVIADVNGGNASVTLTPMFDSVWVKSAVPSWITLQLTQNYVSPNFGATAKLTYQPLPAGVTGRSANILFKTWGAQANVHVSQGNVAGVTSVNVTKSKVINTGAAFELSYPGEFNKVTLIAISGKVIGYYDLPSDGKFSIPTKGISNGIYFLKFAGKETETIKVIR